MTMCLIGLPIKHCVLELGRNLRKVLARILKQVHRFIEAWCVWIIFTSLTKLPHHLRRITGIRTQNAFFVFTQHCAQKVSFQLSLNSRVNEQCWVRFDATDLINHYLCKKQNS